MANGQCYFGTTGDTSDQYVRVNNDGTGTTTVVTNANSATFADGSPITVSRVWGIGLDTS